MWMEVGRALLLFAAYAVWRMTGLRAAGRMLTRTLGSSNESLRAIAGIFLVRGGPRAEPLLEEELVERRNLPIVLTILADVGSAKLEPAMRRFSNDSDPDVARAAQEALRIIKRHAKTGDGML